MDPRPLQPGILPPPPPLAKEPGADAAVSFESGLNENIFLVLDGEGRLRAQAPDGTEAFNRAATWRLEHGEQ
jgi:flagellar basal body rod protein FlgF